MSEAESGHGIEIATEANPVVAGTFVPVAELASDITYPEMSRAETEVTPHNELIDSYVFGVLRRGTLAFDVNWIEDAATHDHETGLLKHLADNERFGVRMRGPGGSAGDDEWIFSGNVQAITPISPIREGARSANIVIRASGPMIIDGTTFGA